MNEDNFTSKFLIPLIVSIIGGVVVWAITDHITQKRYKNNSSIAYEKKEKTSISNDQKNINLHPEINQYQKENCINNICFEIDICRRNKFTKEYKNTEEKYCKIELKNKSDKEKIVSIAGGNIKAYDTKGKSYDSHVTAQSSFKYWGDRTKNIKKRETEILDVNFSFIPLGEKLAIFMQFYDEQENFIGVVCDEISMRCKEYK